MVQSLWFVGPGEVQLKDAPLLEPGADEVRVRGLFSAVSHGTEALLVSGDAPDHFDPSLDSERTSTYPRRYGYAWVGEVLAGGLPLGTRVFSLATHAEAHVLKLNRVRVLPEELPAARATLAASMETALTAVWDAQLCLGANVLVLGAGTIGVLVAHLAVQAGARVVLVDSSLARRQRATALGISDVRALAEGAPEFDVVFEVTGNPNVLNYAVALCRTEGRIVVVSFYGKKSANVSLGERFHRQRLKLVSSQVSAIPPALGGRFDHDRRFETVLHLLKDARLDQLVQARTDFRQAPDTYRRLAQGHVPEQIVFEYALDSELDSVLDGERITSIGPSDENPWS